MDWQEFHLVPPQRKSFLFQFLFISSIFDVNTVVLVTKKENENKSTKKNSNEKVNILTLVAIEFFCLRIFRVVFLI